MAKRKMPSRGGPKRAAKNPAKKARTPSFDLTLVGLWLLILLPPLLFIPGLTDNFRLPKLLLSELLGLLSLAFLAWRLWRKGAVDLLAALRHRGVVAVVPLVLVVSLGWWLGHHPEVTRRALPSLWIGAACLVGWSLALRDDERFRLLRATMWPAGVLALLAVLQFHGVFDPFNFQDRVTDRTRLTSLAGGAFDLSGCLVLPMLIGQAAWADAGRRGRLAIGLFLLLGLWASVAARTVTALLALVIGSGLLWRRRLPRRRLLAAGALGALVLGALVAFGPLGDRAKDMSESLRKGEINRLLTGRLDAWRCALWMLRENPVLGVGDGAFRAEYGPARLALTEAGVGFFRGQRQVFFTNAHSDVLDVAAEWGLAGLAALFAGLWIVARAVRRRWRRRTEQAAAHTEEADAAPAAAVEAADLEQACVAALLVLCLTYFPLHLGLLAYPWLLFASALLGTENPSGGDREIRLNSRLLAVVLTVLLCAALWLRFGTARDLLGASRLLAVVEASSLQAAAAEGPVPPALLRRNLEWLRRAAVLDPAEVAVPLAEGGQYFLMQRYQAAERAYRRALELEMRGEIHANLARCHLASGDRRSALEAIHDAITLDHTQRRVFRDVLRQENISRREAAEDGG